VVEEVVFRDGGTYWWVGRGQELSDSPGGVKDVKQRR